MAKKTIIVDDTDVVLTAPMYQNITVQRDDALQRITNHAAEMDSLRKQNLTDLNNQQKHNDDALSAMQQKHDTTIADLSKQHGDQLKDLQKQQQDQLAQMTQQQADQVKAMQAQITDLQKLVDVLGGTEQGKKMAKDKRLKEIDDSLMSLQKEKAALTQP